MKRINKYVVLLFVTLGLFSASSIVSAEPVSVVELNKPVYSDEVVVKPLDVVNNPSFYLNKTIKMDALFDKFSTLGLDYPPANRPNTDYISFMVLREDTSFEIPLSEMKLFLKRDEAQKFIELKSKDKIQVVGKVFSTALGDPWVDVLELKTVE